MASKITQHYLNFLLLTATLSIGFVVSPIFIKKAEADHCSKIDFTCPPSHRTGPIIKVDPPQFDHLKCQSWWNCDQNQIQINSAVIAAKKTGLIKNREECKAYVKQTIGMANEELQGLPGLDFFLRRGTNQGNDSCDLQFAETVTPSGNYLVCITNKTNVLIDYKMNWSNESQQSRIELKPKDTWRHWRNNSTASVKFSFNSGGNNKTYNLPAGATSNTSDCNSGKRYWVDFENSSKNSFGIFSTP